MSVYLRVLEFGFSHYREAFRVVLGFGERAPWGDFPAVIRNGDLFAMKSHPGYALAKSGDRAAALDLVENLLTDETVRKIGVFSSDIRPTLLPVLAAEASGHNKIPLAMAEVLGHRLGLEVDHGIVQREKIGRTGAGADHRLVCNPSFDGVVERGKFYIIVDDAVTMGGTVASLRGFVENRGGSVLAATAMAVAPDRVDLKVSSDMLRRIQARHGSGMDDLAREFTGHGIDKLTQFEAGHFRAAQSVDAMRTRLVAARDAALGRVDEKRAGTPVVQAVQEGQRMTISPTQPRFGGNP